MGNHDGVAFQNDRASIIQDIIQGYCCSVVKRFTIRFCLFNLSLQFLVVSCFSLGTLYIVLRPASFREVCIDKLEFNPDGTIKRVVPTHRGISLVDFQGRKE